MWNYLVAVIFFILLIITHETAHLLSARHYGFEAKFIWIPVGTKDLTSNAHIPLPGTRVMYDRIPTKREFAVILLSPIIPTYIFSVLIYVSVFWIPEDLPLVIAFSLLIAPFTTFAGCISDIKDYTKYYTYTKIIGHN